MQSLRRYNLYYFIFLFGIIVLLPVQKVEAARLFFATKSNEVGVGQELEVSLRLDTEGEIINAIEGEISLPEIISAEFIRDGNSIIALWAQRPEIKANQTIIFSGIIPGGRETSDEEIFSFIAKTNTQGIGKVALASARVLLHDGKGTETETRTEELALRADIATPLTDFIVEADLEPPEEFKLYLADDPNIFSGDYFLVFASQDKGSGIAYYEIQETKEKLVAENRGEWQVAKSPYKIKDQKLKHFVYVRAVDHSGNVRVAVFAPPAEGVLQPFSYFNYKYIALAFLLLPSKR